MESQIYTQELMEAWGEGERERAGDGSEDQGAEGQESMAALHGSRLRDEAWLTEHGQGPREPLTHPLASGQRHGCAWVGWSASRRLGNSGSLERVLESATLRDTFLKAKREMRESRKILGWSSGGVQRF